MKGLPIARAIASAVNIATGMATSTLPRMAAIWLRMTSVTTVASFSTSFMRPRISLIALAITEAVIAGCLVARVRCSTCINMNRNA